MVTSCYSTLSSIDAPCAARRSIARNLNICRGKIFHCTAPQNVLLDRLAARRGDASDAGPQLLAQQIRDFEEFEESERADLIEINTSAPMADQLAAAKKNLSVPAKPH